MKLPDAVAAPVGLVFLERAAEVDLTSATPERFPALRRMLAAGIFDAADTEDTEFEFGIGRVLDGVAVLVDR